jgi:hypothetical protein
MPQLPPQAKSHLDGFLRKFTEDFVRPMLHLRAMAPPMPPGESYYQASKELLEKYLPMREAFFRDILKTDLHRSDAELDALEKRIAAACRETEGVTREQLIELFKVSRDYLKNVADVFMAMLKDHSETPGYERDFQELIDQMKGGPVERPENDPDNSASIIRRLSLSAM